MGRQVGMHRFWIDLHRPLRRIEVASGHGGANLCNVFAARPRDGACQ